METKLQSWSVINILFLQTALNSISTFAQKIGVENKELVKYGFGCFICFVIEKYILKIPICNGKEAQG